MQTPPDSGQSGFSVSGPRAYRGVAGPSRRRAYRAWSDNVSIQDVEAEAGGKGGSTEVSSPQEKEVAGLRAELQRRTQQNHALETEKAELKGAVDTLKQAPKPTAKEWTRPELQKAVDDGRIDQLGADRIIEEQAESRITASVSERIETTMQARTLTDRINTELGKYKDLKPDVMVEGSADRAAVGEEFDYQVNVLGKPNDLATELDTLRAVFGPSVKLAKGKAKDPETHEETGGASEETASSSDGAPKGLTAPNRAYYQGMIDSGQYKDWAAVKSDLSLASAKVKRRLGVA